MLLLPTAKSGDAASGKTPDAAVVLLVLAIHPNT
jgi:hypothetical protein